MLNPDDEPLSDEDRRAVAASREWLRRNPDGCVRFEQVVAECTPLSRTGRRVPKPQWPNVRLS